MKNKIILLFASLVLVSLVSASLNVNNGNVGIGTTSPDAALDVVGDVDLSGSLRVDSQIFGSVDGSSNPYINIPSSNELKFLLNAQGGTEIMVIEAGGNVGIGTTIPSQKLHLSSTTTSTLLQISATDGGSTTGIKLHSLTGPGASRMVYLENEEGIFKIDTQTYSNVLAIPDSGNVGIGTTSPEGMLGLGTSPGSPGNLMLGDGGAIGQTYSAGTIILGHNVKAQESTNSGRMVYSLGSSVGGSAIVLGAELYGTASDGIQFHVESGSHSKGETFSSEAMRISMNGNVGIGTTSPGGKLEVKSNADDMVGYFFNSKNNGGSDDVVYIKDDRGYSSVNSGNNLKLYSWSTGDDTGNLIDAVTFAGGSEVVRFRVTLNGDVCGPDSDLSNCASDKQLKENITSYAIGLEEILKLKPVEFYWNKKAEELGFDPHIKALGLVAQDVEAIIPEWVSINEDGYKKVEGEGNLKYALVNAIQELKEEKDKEITELKKEKDTEIKGLQDQINLLNKKIDSLEKEE